jgi:pimeloyl-ACP methyl ester carboxylesterase
VDRRPIAVNGVELDYVDQGSGDPVVFSHGGASDLRYWEPQRSTFAPRFRFIAYTRRFHGDGAWPATADASPEAHADDLIEVVRRLEQASVHLVGFSAATALHAAVREPSLFRSLTIFEPNAPSLLTDDPADQAVLADWQSATARLRIEHRDDAGAYARHWFELVNNAGSGTFQDQPEEFRRMWLENFGAKRSPSTGPELSCSALDAVTMPALALGSEFGMPYSRRILRRVAECIPGCELKVLPGVTHFASFQAPSVFNAAVLDFIARH